jgi:DUF1680 family protein
MTLAKMSDQASKRRLATCLMGLAILAAAVAATSRAAAPVKPAKDYPYQPLPFTDVHLTDAFWTPRIETNRSVTIPYAFEQCRESGRFDNFERAAKALRGEPFANHKAPGFPFDDTDPYKVLEGASYGLAVHPDAKMKTFLDDLITTISRAQEPDGYLYTTRTIKPNPPSTWMGATRWVGDPKQSHELYDAGHLFEAAAAHYQATGERNLLDVATKEADLLVKTFGTGPGQIDGIWPGHEIVEMGLAKLYRVTGDARYLKLAKYFIDVRGSHPGGDDYHQSKIPPVRQTEAIGHAVRAGYLYSGMADVAALTGDPQYAKAIDAIWNNCVGKKLYITGGIGANARGEAFGRNYSLDNLTAYCETCAAVANVYWNQRLFLLHGDAKYIDVLERTLYNGLLSGVSLDGKKFFYPNPLESEGNYERSPWFGCACCPGNIARFMASAPGYFYATRGDAIYVNLFAGGTAKIALGSGRAVELTQETRYPWDGAVKIAVAPDRAAKFTIDVRVPGWARGQAVPSDLYQFKDADAEKATLKVNGKAVPVTLDKGYVSLTRRWKKGDAIELTLPMPVRRVVANPQVKADIGRVALQRGPIVYCAEWPDNPGGGVRDLALPDDAKLTSRFEPGLLGGVQVIDGPAVGVTFAGAGKPAQAKRALRAIPYYAWANRGKGDMIVWLPSDVASVPRVKATVKFRKF